MEGKGSTRRSRLIVCSANHKNTNAKVERANGVIGDTLRAYANGRKDDWDKQLTFAEFAINNAASTLGGEADMTPFFIDRGAHPRLPLSAPHAEHAAHESPGQYAQRMRSIEATVRELLAARRAASKAKLDAGRVDTLFKVGDRARLRTKALLDAANIGKLRPRWDGPFTATACPRPNAYTLALPRKMRCSSTINVDRLKPFFERSDKPPPPGPISDAARRAGGRIRGGPATQPPGGAGSYRAPTPRQQMPGGGWRSWTIAAAWPGWRSTMPSRPTALALPLSGPSFGDRGRGQGWDRGPLLHQRTR